MPTQQGFLLIADITGYTAYLNASELEHAQGVLQDLLELLIDHTRPPLVISRLAGDAVISYGLQGAFVSGQTFVEMLEETYVDFRRAIDLILVNTSCRCNACVNISNLDLKFFVHYGTFVLQKLDAHAELVGPDVNFIHRLLKNQVSARTGIRAYTLYSAAAIAQLGIEEFAATLTAHTESYPDFGEARVLIQDMHPVWAAMKDRQRIEIPDQGLFTEQSVLLPLSLAQAWEVVTNLEYRSVAMNAVWQKVEGRQAGRIGPGSVYHCHHGDGRATLQTIVEWIPLERITTRDTIPLPRTTCLTSMRLAPEEAGTRLTVRLGAAEGPWIYRSLATLMGKTMFPKGIGQGMAALKAKVEQELGAG